MATATLSPALVTDSSASSVDVLSTIIELQRSVDKLNSRLVKGETPQEIDARIKKINEQVAKISSAYEAELDAVTTWGMGPKTWKWIGRGATALVGAAEIACLGTNLPFAGLGNETLTEVIISSSVTGGVGLLAFFILGVYSYGQEKLDERMDAMKEKVRQQEMLQMFFHSYQEFIAAHPHQKSLTDSAAQYNELKQCIENLKKIPSVTMKQEDKDHWMCSLIEVLPDDNELKKKLIEQKEIALKINAKKATNESAKIMDDGSDSDKGSFLKVSRAVQAGKNDFASSYTDLEAIYQKNLQEFRAEFGMDINEFAYGGYRFDSNCNLKKIEITKSKNEVRINMS